MDISTVVIFVLFFLPKSYKIGNKQVPESKWPVVFAQSPKLVQGLGSDPRHVLLSVARLGSLALSC